MGRPARTPAQEEDESQLADAGEVLQFNEPLSWKAGKPIPVTTLIKRLKTLSKQLSELEQEGVDRDSLTIPARELAGVSLMTHKDPGVRAYTACCLADMLRLHAPDAPYTANQLRDIFELFVKQLKGIADTENPYYQQYLYLLDSLSTVKSVILISDIPNGDAITLQLFTSFFDMVKPDGKKDIEYHMTEILVQLIDESNSLPSEVIDIIVAQFLRAVPTAVQNTGTKKSKAGLDPKDKVGFGKGAKNGAGDKQMTLVSALPPPAYNMAKTICNSCVDKMARHICQYFSEVILDVSPASKSRKSRHTSMSPDPDEDDEDDGAHEPSHDDLRELHKAHMLVKELWKACPQVLQNVIPQLEQELLAENSELRELSTETIGDIALTGNFGSSMPATWKVWVGRANDKSSAVRAKWVTAAVRIVKERNDHMAVQLAELIAGKLNDLDDRVRLAACEALAELDYLSITVKLAADESPFNTFESGSATGITSRGKGKARETADENNEWGKKILQNLGDRVRDKKLPVRFKGMTCLARMWDMAYADIVTGNEVVMQQLGWIPSRILDTFYINDPDVNVLLDHVLHEILLPVNFPPLPVIQEKDKEKNGEKAVNGKNGKGKDKEAEREKEKLKEKEKEREQQEGDKIRTERLLVLVKGLDPKAKKALFAVPLRQMSYAKVMEVFLKACEDFNGGVTEEGVDETAVNSTLNKFSDWLAQKLPDQTEAREHLQKFAKWHDRRCYQLVRFCYSPESDYRTVVKALKEIKKRIGDAPGTTPAIAKTLTPLLYRVSQLIYNKSHVPPIVEFSRTDEVSLSSVAHEVLKEMSVSNPAVFKANVKALSDLLQEQSPASGRDSGAVDTLKACAGFAKSYPKDMPQERKLLQALVSFALTGKPPAAAKHAVTILMYSATRKEMYAADLVKRCIKDFAFGEEHFLAKLACLGQLVLLAPDQCEDEANDIIDIARDVLLKVRRPASEEEKSTESEWCEDDQLDDEIKAKLLALRILVNRLRAHTDSESVRNIAAPVMKLLLTTIVKEGELSKKGDTPRTHQSRLRLTASQLLLKLALIKPYDDLITPHEFNRIATVAQDHSLGVRQGFIDKVKKYLASGKLGPRWYTVIFLMAYEPNEEMKEEAVTWIKARASSLSIANKGKKMGPAAANVMESVFARLLSLLAHHPDFGTQVEDLADFAKYILFYLKAVANEENLSLIYYVAQRVKQFRDGLSPENSDNLYYLSELAQAVIRKLGDAHNWNIAAWPGKLRLPAGLFAPMQNSDQSSEVARKTYLPPKVDVKLDGLIRSRSGGRGKKRKSDPNNPNRLATPAKKKYKSSSTSNNSPSTATATTPSTTTIGRKPGRPPKTSKNPKSSKLTVSISISERRRSGRATARVSYAMDEEDEDEPMPDLASSDDGDEDQDEAEAEGTDTAAADDDDDDAGQELDEIDHEEEGKDKDKKKPGVAKGFKVRTRLARRENGNGNGNGFAKKNTAVATTADDDDSGDDDGGKEKEKTRRGESSELSDPPDSDLDDDEK